MNAPETRTGVLTVDTEVCEAYAVCVGIDSDMFELDDEEDFVHVISQPSTPEQWSRADQAVRSCPKRALSFAERPTTS